MSKEKKARNAEDAPEEQVKAAESGKQSEQEDTVEIKINGGDGRESGEAANAEAEGDQDAAEDDASVEAALEDEMAALSAEIADLKDQLLRKQADFENFRKRMIRDREEAVRYANTSLLLDLVEIIDNFERAIKSSEDSRDFDSFHEGVEMIEKQFTSMLDTKYGLKRFESLGEEFDPEKHEAIAAVESEEADSQVVLDDFQKGYMLHDRVLRHAKVRVVVPAVPAADDGEEENEQQE